MNKRKEMMQTLMMKEKRIRQWETHGTLAELRDYLYDGADDLEAY